MSPRKQERLFEKSYSEVLLNISKGDYRTAIGLSGLKDIRVENIFFHAQQAIEKALKAVLVAKAIPVPMVHDLGALLGKLPSDCDPPYGYELNELNQYAAARRYEEGVYVPTSEDIDIVLRHTKEMIDWAVAVVETLSH